LCISDRCSGLPDPFLEPAAHVILSDGSRVASQATADSAPRGGDTSEDAR
jgi:hypothetical protein